MPTRALLLALWFGCGAAIAAAEEPNDFFEKKIRPLLVEKCFKCHGGEETEAGLKLTSRAALLSGGDSGPAVVPGKPAESLLVEVINYKGDIQMPPDGKLPEAEIAALAKWVELSLPWPGGDVVAPAAAAKFTITPEQRAFWSLQPIRVGGASFPRLKNAGWVKNDIDRYILAKLEASGLSPAAPADKRTLLRRVTFDLTGLPPTPEENAAFLADDSPEAFERVIDRLLASPRYGERWGRHWLDVVRYTDSADSRIVGSNNEMDFNEAWRYRDWVVEAFNNDLPYDQFVQLQIAGDVLPGKEGGFHREGIIATGMLAIGNWGGGDSDKEKLLTDIADDQVDVVSRAFLGLTIACARCHDHKFDPISTEDYYALAGIFFSSHILRDPGPKTNGPPILRIPLESPEEAKRRTEYDQRLKQLAEQLEQERDAAIAQRAKDELPRAAEYVAAVLAWDGQSAEQLAAVAREHKLDIALLRRWHEYLGRGDRKVLANQRRDVQNIAGLHAYDGGTGTPNLIANTTERDVAFITIKMPPRSVAVHPGPTTGVAVGWTSPFSGKVALSGKVADADGNCGNGIAWKLSLRGGSSAREVAAGLIVNGGKQPFDAAALASVAVRSGEVLELAILPQGEYSCDTTVVELEIREIDGEGRSWSLTRSWLAESREAWMCYELLSGSTPLVSIPAESALAKLLATKKEERSAAITALNQSMAQAIDDKHPDAAWRKDFLAPRGNFWNALRERNELFAPEQQTSVARLRAELDALRKNPPPPPEFANGCAEGGCPQSPHAGVHDVRVHIRGRYDRLGKEVPRRFPEILAGTEQRPITSGSGRRELAAWVGSDRQPLTARVMANRVWQHHFGRGLVGTPNNFGKLGEAPTHPELLDYLAASLIENRWSVKALHKQILLSSTYQQSSAAGEAALARDPDNRLWGRMNRRRLEAEAIRDAMLVVGGKLDERRGGPAVRGFDHNRRTLYAMTIRSDRSTFRELFDAADSTAIVEARVTSTVAPQALYFLNHPFTEQTAKSLSERVLAQQSSSTSDRIQLLHAWLYNRPASDAEAALAQRLLGEAPDAARWQRYCHVLLCANEFVYID